MKRRLAQLGLLCMTVVIATAYAQQPPKATPPIALNPGASKAVDDIEAGKKACLDSAQQQEALILLGANVPKGFQCKRTENGWICSAPETAKASPLP